MLEPRSRTLDEFDERARLPIVPLRLVSAGLVNLNRWVVAACAASLLVHAGFAAFFLLLPDPPGFPDRPEGAIPVEVVASVPAPPEAPPPPRREDVPPPPPTSAPARGEAPAPPPLVAPPPEPRQAAPGTTPVPPAVAASPPSAEAPAVLSAATGAFAMPPPGEPPPPRADPAPPALNGTAAATLARALPMDVSALPSTFQSVLSSAGAQSNRDYRGIVYGRLQRSRRAMEEARARHLRGQVIVSFGIDAEGHATNLTIAASSGSPALDALGLAMVREAEPFPPPPAGAAQTFTPAFAMGGE